MKKRMKAVCVICGSNRGERPSYVDSASRLGKLLAERQLRLVYGGGQVGLMGTVADAVLDGGGEVYGVIPEALAKKEIAHPGTTKLFVVQSMHIRKQKMMDLSDAYITLPGGFGTMDELYEALTWGQLGIHNKPIGMLNVDGYYDQLLSFMDFAVTEGFVRPAHRELLIVEMDPARLLDRLAGFSPSFESKLDALTPLQP